MRAKLGDQDTTAISGALMRWGWKLAERAIFTGLRDKLDTLNDQTQQPHRA